MANLKLDLKNKINNDKYYQELELVRLAQDPNTNYEGKIAAMQFQLQQLAFLNAELSLIEQYFQEPPVATPAPVGPTVQAQPAGVVHPGQTHGE